MYSLGSFFRPNKGYTAASFATAAVELLFLEDGLSLTCISSFFGFTRFDLVTFQSFSTFLHLKRSQ